MTWVTDGEIPAPRESVVAAVQASAVATPIRTTVTRWRAVAFVQSKVILD
jgi:hypothetical protein